MQQATTDTFSSSTNSLRYNDCSNYNCHCDKKTQKQKNLNKLLENQTNGLEDYMDLYMNYTSQSYGAVYEEYRINRCQFKQMLISIIILILFMIIGICANRSVQKSAAQKRQEQQQERYVDGLKKSVKVQKSNQ